MIPIIPVASGALPYENNELDLTALQAGDLKRLQTDPRSVEGRLPVSVPGHLVPAAAGDEAALRQREGAPGGGARDRPRERGEGEPGLRHPRLVDDPARLPRRDRRPQDQGHPEVRQEGGAWSSSRARRSRAGKNWPKITLTMRDEALGSKPLAEAVQAVLLDTLNMKTDLEVLEQRVFRERLWKQDLQFVWIRWFMDYPDPHNEYFDTFYGKKTTGRRQAWVNDAFDKELEAGRDTRDPKKRLEHYTKAEEIMQKDVGYVPVAWVVRYGGQEAVGGGHREEQGGRVRRGRQHLRGHAPAHLHHREGLGRPEGASRPPPKLRARRRRSRRGQMRGGARRPGARRSRSQSEASGYGSPGERERAALSARSRAPTAAPYRPPARRPWAVSDWVGSREKWLWTQRQRPS